jgi:hypothetical protein
VVWITHARCDLLRRRPGDERCGELQADGARRPTGPPASALQAGLLIAGSSQCLWALVSAPAPVTGIKWFWLWLVSGMPLGVSLGLIGLHNLLGTDLVPSVR